MTAEGRGNRKVLLLSGPNLQLFGERQPEIYGTESLDDMVRRARLAAEFHGLELEHLQSDAEAGLIAAVHAARRRQGSSGPDAAGAASGADAIVINAGALSHYGWALHDALAAYDGVVVELHVSNPLSREPWRHTSVIAPVADGSIAGFGPLGYELAIEAVARLLGE